ncbi:serine/threonine-protein phosphatase 2A activator-like [Lineus longissimus]|uniref:serine/threonine-protein phosphatase 2A activator-like n=1 Tax=Lineus longissimus TaxID=88925 RepID=UPI002B4E4AE1
MALPKLERGPPGRLGGPRSHPAPEIVDVEKHAFTIPQRAVLNVTDIQKWEKSKAYHDLLGFITVLNDSVRGKKMSQSPPDSMSDNVKKVIEVLEEMDKWIAEIPAIDQPQRFGNKAFRDWFQRLQEKSEDLVQGMLGETYPDSAVKELSVYLVESVGNKTRIDYGTGHEMAYIFFLCCLYKIGFLKKEDYCTTALNIFNKYVILMRKLQNTYNMEPAGSQGVWSIDDYQFIPFVWGSAQLLDQAAIEPRHIPEADRNVKWVEEYMFFQCIAHINTVKTGPFSEHSNVLWGISGVQFWSKVNGGLIKMYKAEVLPKFPIIQHVLFGSLMSIDPVTALT